MTDQSFFDQYVVQNKKRGIIALTSSRKEQEIEARKKDILEISAELFAQKDFHGVTMDEIAEKVGLSKGTLYLYFETKEKLFFSILIERTQSLIHSLKDTIQSNTSFATSLYDFVLTFLNYFQTNKAYFKLMHCEKTRASMGAHYQMHDYANKIFHQFNNILTELIQKGVDENYLRSVDIFSMVKMLGGILNNFIYYRIFVSSKNASAEETALIINLFLNGAKKEEVTEVLHEA